MADKFQIGGIEAKLTVDMQEFNQSTLQAENRMRGLYTQVNTMPPAIQKLQQQEEKLTRQMEEQRKKVAQLYANLDEAATSYAELEKAMGRVGDVDLSKKFAKESAEIDKAEAQMAEYAQKLQLVEKQKQQAAEKMNASGIAAVAKQQYKDSSLAIDSMANALRGLSPVLGDSVSGISTMAERLVFMKRSMDTAASSSAAMMAGITGGVTLAVSAIGILANAWEESEQKRQRAYEEAIAALEEHEDALERAKESIDTIVSQTTSVRDLITARQELADIFPQLVFGYDKEGNAILANNKYIEEQIELLQKRSMVERQVALDNQGDVFDNYNNAAQKEVAPPWWASILPAGISDIVTAWNLSNTDASELVLAKLEAELAVREKVSLTLEQQMALMGELNDEQKVVADEFILSTQNEILGLDNKQEQTKLLADRTKELKELLSDENAYKLKYDVIVENRGGDTNGITTDMISNVDKLAEAIKREAKDQAEQTYQDALDRIQEEQQGIYDSSKAQADRAYQIVSANLQAQQNAYRSMKFDVRSLDEQDLANKLDLFRRQLEAEQNMQAKSVMAVQERYYKEAQLIVETANKAIQVHKDQLSALDEADRQAEEARTARQNQNKLRDLNESYTKQQAENDREMAAALEKYEKQRDELQAIIDNPPSRTAGILAQRDLDALNKQWAEEREGLEIDHADKLLQIQRKLDEEKLTQQEQAEAAQRDKERERLNEQITDLQNNANQQLEILNNRYTVEKEVQQKALDEMAATEKTNYRQRLDELKKHYDNEVEEQSKQAKRIRDAAISDAELTRKAEEAIMQKKYDDLLKMAEQFSLDFTAAGKSTGEKWSEALRKGMEGAADWRSQVPPSLPDYYPPNLRTPGYAAGGIVSRPTYALVGEGGEPEAILPMSKLYDLVNGVLAGSQAFMARAASAMEARTGNYPAGRSTVVNVARMEVRRDADIHLLAAEISGYAGGGSRW